MVQNIKAMWVAALRSNVYIQTPHYLRRGSKLDALGVLCELHRLATRSSIDWQPHFGNIPDKKEHQVYSYLNEFQYLPKEVQLWCGLNGPSVNLPYNNRLYDIIDLQGKHKFTLVKIAKLIENNRAL